MPRPSAASILLPKPSSLTGATTFEASTVMTAGPAANSAGAAARAAAVRVRDRYFMANLLCSPKSCHPSATGLGSFGPNAQKLRVLFGGPALRCSVRLRRTHTFEKGIVDIFPKSCHPSSFAEAAEDKSGLSSTALARRMILFGGPALRCSVRLRRTHTLEKGIVTISMVLTYHLFCDYDWYKIISGGTRCKPGRKNICANRPDMLYSEYETKK